MTKDEALKLALEALTNAYWPTEADLMPAHNIKECADAITAIKEALAQPEQEPVVFEEWLSNQHGDPEEIGFLQALRIAYISGQDSIITPPQRKPLTDEEIRLQWSEFWETECHPWAIEFARAIEAAVWEKQK